MILLCDFNPKIVRSYRSIDFIKNGVNKFSENRIYSSGNGLDMLVYLKLLGSNPKLITFLGGETGGLIKNDLDTIEAKIDYVKIKDNSVEELLIKSRNLKTVFKSDNPRITTEDEENFYSIFKKELENKKIVGIPKYESDMIDIKIYRSLINQCYKNGIKVGITTDNIFDLGDSKPFLLITNKEALEDYTKLSIKTQSEVVKASTILLNKGLGILAISSKKGIIFITKEESFRVDYEDFETTLNKENKNLMLAGICFAIDRDYDFITSVKIAVASMLVENFIKFRMANMADIKKLMNKIEVKKIGGNNEKL
ncbi:MAG: PfkB family carbohydrate kinase [Peptoniphilaceae bacterium]